MIDLSRNAVKNIDSIKKLLRLCALFGYNELWLYMEDVYTIESEPSFGRMRGRYSREELQEIASYAKYFDIEIIPCIQTLAHLNQLLRNIEYATYKDIDDIILCGEEKTYTLIEKMFQTLSAALPSRKIHIGMDEAHNLGRGKYADKFSFENPYSIFLKHLHRINNIAAKYGYEHPMLWSDMFFRTTFNGEYYIYNKNEKFPSNITRTLPENLELVYWDYYSMQENEYLNMLSMHQNFNNTLIFAGGTWCWNGLVPHNELSIKTLTVVSAR